MSATDGKSDALYIHIIGYILTLYENFGTSLACEMYLSMYWPKLWTLELSNILYFENQTVLDSPDCSSITKAAAGVEENSGLY